jgi:hypothetical protein
MRMITGRYEDGEEDGQEHSADYGNHGIGMIGIRHGQDTDKDYKKR